MAQSTKRYGDGFKDAQRRYQKDAERRARAKGMSTLDYLATKTALFDVDNVSPEILAIRKQEIARGVQPILVAEKPDPNALPAEDAEIEISIREPRGAFKFKLSVPRIGEAVSADRRNITGYRELFNRGLLYALYGELH